MAKQVEPQVGPLGRLMGGYEAETDAGPTWVRPLDSIVEIAKGSPGMECPRCKHNCKLFFGDPDGEHWCICCQGKQEFSL